jgi:hypothetical protein
MASLPDEVANLEGKQQRRILPRQAHAPRALARWQAMKVQPIEPHSARPRFQVSAYDFEQG